MDSSALRLVGFAPACNARIAAAADVPGLDHVTFRSLPPSSSVLPMKTERDSGGPVRVVAPVPRADGAS